MKKSDTSVQATSIGNAFAILVVVALDYLKVEITIVEVAVLIGAFTVIFNYFVPADKLRSFHK